MRFVISTDGVCKIRPVAVIVAWRSSSQLAGEALAQRRFWKRMSSSVFEYIHGIVNTGLKSIHMNEHLPCTAGVHRGETFQKGHVDQVFIQPSADIKTSSWY